MFDILLALKVRVAMVSAILLFRAEQVSLEAWIELTIHPPSCESIPVRHALATMNVFDYSRVEGQSIDIFITTMI